MLPCDKHGPERTQVMDLSALFRTTRSPPLLPQYEYELPVLNGPRKVARPPRMASSLALSTSHLSPTVANLRAAATVAGPLLVLERKEKQLQRHLQMLLDAQGDGLLAGLVQGGAPDSDSHGRSTPTTSASNVRPPPTVPVRQPRPEKIGLRAARRGIADTMQELALVKGEEETVIEAEMRDREGLLTRVEEWRQTREGLEAEIRRIKTTEEGQLVEDLQAQEKALQGEIHDMETRLYELKAKHLHLTSELSQIENAVQAKLSSYQASLSDLDKQVHGFLAKPPRPILAVAPAASSSTFVSLPASRRTLEMAREYWESENQRRLERRRQTQMERDALVEGREVWKEVVKEVVYFERQLRLQVQGLTPPAPTGHGRSTSGAAPHGLRELLLQMDLSVARLEEKLELAEKRDWTLLQCCIGAEVEAFREGREILQAASDAVDGPGKARLEVGVRGRSEGLHTDSRQSLPTGSDHGLGELQDEPEGFHDAVEKTGYDHDDHDHDDQDPDPAFMFSRGETD
ncbi:MAG: hypothetical protein M1838_000870 [Thelocarpon superellum]|nr:MAG: hypothetical protein M1838_000870 [Thelocarpon superellum]